jgi:hypothetical protein
VGTSQINSLASSGFTEQHAPSSELQWRATLPAVLQAATPSADFNYKSPGHRNQPPTITSRAPHNASCVFTKHVNETAYHLQPNINCGDTAPTTRNGGKGRVVWPYTPCTISSAALLATYAFHCFCTLYLWSQRVVASTRAGKRCWSATRICIEFPPIPSEAPVVLNGTHLLLLLLWV